MRLTAVEKNICIAEFSVKADSFFMRLRGMIGRKFTADFDAVIFDRCNCIHTCWMQMPLDVIFIDSSRRVTKVFENLKPWRFAAGGRDAVCTIELPAGTLANRVSPGDKINFAD